MFYVHLADGIRIKSIYWRVFRNLVFQHGADARSDISYRKKNLVMEYHKHSLLHSAAHLN
jgi:hypothetical protein